MIDGGETRAIPDRAPFAFALKAPIADLRASVLAFRDQKTMYGGKAIAIGSGVYLFDSENQGGRGLVAKGRVVSARAVPRRPDLRRQTPRVDVAVEVLAAARIALGRSDLKPFSAWYDGRPETEIAFKLYRQATNKIVGVTASASRFLDGMF